ncbi:hypothetical protein [Nocardia salmonicida]|uniref:hypothetical protein n=1 Tax=Nocardia salmonicida TaxID=53431 RepID=UPI0033FDE4C2
MSTETVWKRASKTVIDQESTRAQRRSEWFSPAGEIVAVTASGPIAAVSADLVVVPLESGLALVQELAARMLEPDAKVISSLALRVSGESAEATWRYTSSFICGSLIDASPAARLELLSGVLDYIRRQRNANGLETILCTAVNAAWPWISWTTLDAVLRSCQKYIQDSEVSHRFSIPVLDPNTLEWVQLIPDDLQSDIDSWLANTGLETDINVISDRLGFGGGGLPDSGGAGTSGGLSLGGGGNGRGTSDGPLDRLGFGGGGLPDSGGAGTSGGLSLGHGRGGTGAKHGVGPFNGGPTGFGSGLGSSGASLDSSDWAAIGEAATVAGTALAKGSPKGKGGAVTKLIGAGLIAVGAAASAHALVTARKEGEDKARQAAEAKKKADDAKAAEAAKAKGKEKAPAEAKKKAEDKKHGKKDDHTSHKKGADKKEESKEKPHPEKPKKSDVYLDPNHHGGGSSATLPDGDDEGNPVILPDGDDEGNPVILPDGDDEGNPVILPDGDDEGNPVITADFVSIRILEGPGLGAAITTQTGTRTWALDQSILGLGL